MSHLFIPIETAKLSWPEGLPFSDLFNDIYFSIENGLAEKQHVFIEGNNLIERFKSLPEHANFIIAELGFGSGLNFLLTCKAWLTYAPKTAKLYYYSCEQFPLSKEDLMRCLSLWPELEAQAKSLIENYPILTPGFHPLQFAEGRINLIMMLGEASASLKQLLVCGDPQLEEQLRSYFIDAWYLDGFSPAKNQSLWSQDLFELVALLSRRGTSLATYSAAGVVKENLQAFGFSVKKIKGFSAKREMIIAEFTKHLSANKKLRTTPWQVSDFAQDKNHSLGPTACPRDPEIYASQTISGFRGQAAELRDKNFCPDQRVFRPYKNITKKAIILGAGLAGCFIANALAKRGFELILIDENAEAGQGASANRQAVLYPNLSAYRSPLTQFMLSSFLFASRFYRDLLDKKSLIGELNGSLQLAFNEQERLAQEKLIAWLNAYPELARLIDADEATQLSGINLVAGGLYIANSGWIDSPALCQFLKQTESIKWFPKTSISEIIYQDGFWRAGHHQAEILILANGHQASHFAQTAYLPLKAIRGQMTMIAANKESLGLKIPLCGDGHILPAQQDLHVLGASYHLSNSDKSAYLKDDQDNLKRLASWPTELTWHQEIQANWVGIRAATTDYLPLVGPVPNVSEFNLQYASLASNAKRWLPRSGAYLPGLFLFAGFGSRGLTTIPLAAEYLSSLINNEPLQIPQSMVKSLAPSRFLVKDLVKGKTSRRHKCASAQTV